MSVIGQIIIIHLAVGLMAAFCIITLRSRRFDNLTYNSRMKSPFRRFLMTGKLADREVWVRQQRMLSWFGLIFCTVVYVLVMMKILS